MRRNSRRNNNENMKLNRGKNKEKLKNWIIAKLSDLHDLANIINKQKPIAFDPRVDEFKAHPWTILKLQVLLSYNPVYTMTIGKRYPNMVYIDLFSGSGLSAYEDSSVPIAGSPIISLITAMEPYTHVYLNDMDWKKIHILRKRINFLKKTKRINNKTQIKYYNSDANRVLNNILSDLKLLRKWHALVFIDPPGLEFKWESLEKLLKLKNRLDIIMLFQSYSVAIQALNHLRYGRSAMALNEFIGDADWPEYLVEKAKIRGVKAKELRRVDIEDYMKNYYITKIKKVLRKYGHHDVVIDINIRLEGLMDASYSILFISKYRGRYLEVVNALKEKIEAAPRDFIDRVVSSFKSGRLAPGLTEYIDDYVREIDSLRISRRFKIIEKRTKPTLDDFF